MSMAISQLIEKMIDFSEGNVHDIDHLTRVWTYAGKRLLRAILLNEGTKTS